MRRCALARRRFVRAPPQYCRDTAGRCTLPNSFDEMTGKFRCGTTADKSVLRRNGAGRELPAHTALLALGALLAAALVHHA